MTKQRRDETFNLQLAELLLKKHKDLMEDYDIKLLKDLVNVGKKKITPIYRQSGEDLDGRNICELGLCAFSRKVRNSLAYQYYYDVDIVNSGYTWLFEALKENNIKVKQESSISQYYHNRDELLEKEMKNGKSRDEVKQKYLKLLFDGKTSPTISKTLYNKLIVKDEFKDIYEKSMSRDTNKIGSFMCMVYHKWEWKTLCNIMNFFDKHRVETYADLHDGFYVKKFKRNVDQIERINEVIRLAKKKLNITLKVKVMDDLLNIPKEFIEDTAKAICNSDKDEYEYYRDKFYEQYGVVKVLEQEKYLLERPDGNYGLMNQQTLVNMFSDWKVPGDKTFDLGWFKGGRRFIHNYILDPFKKIVDRIDFYPCDADCPSNVYNSFKGFYIKKISDDTIDFSEQDHKDLELIIEHLKMLVNDGENYVEECNNYLLDWIAQLFQEPNIKPNTMIILKSEEGVGKSLLAYAIGKMLDEKYFYESTKPKRDLCGNFNSIGKNKMLICFDEGKGDEMESIYEELKNMITNPKATCREKYEKEMFVNDYRRYIMTTNNESVMKISDSNRRFVAFETTSPPRDDIVETIVPAFKNEKALVLFYRFLMERDISKRVWKNFPKTNYYKRNLDASISFTWKFIDHIFTTEGVGWKQGKGYNYIKQTIFREHYEEFCLMHKCIAQKKSTFDNEMVATNIFKSKRRSAEGDCWVFNEEKVIEKLKKMGLYQTNGFLE